LFFPSSFREQLEYRERTAGVTLNQLLQDDWALGGQYSFTRSELEFRTPALGQFFNINTGSFGPAKSSLRADLHRFNLFVLYNHPSGFFARTDLDYFLQTRSRALVSPGEIANVGDETLPQLGVQVGYRFPKQHGDITLGVLNLMDEDYRLNPVTPYNELPRERVFLARLRFKF
jgi:hypothetical protein